MGSRACSPGKFLNLESLKCNFPDFRERFNRILMVIKRHCNISEASLANAFALQPETGGPHLAHWGWGPRVCPVRTHSSYATVICVTSWALVKGNPWKSGTNIIAAVAVRITFEKSNIVYCAPYVRISLGTPSKVIAERDVASIAI
jgi:hypothetical protein